MNAGCPVGEPRAYAGRARAASAPLGTPPQGNRETGRNVSRRLRRTYERTRRATRVGPGHPWIDPELDAEIRYRQDELAPARGVLLGCLLGCAMWSLIGISVAWLMDLMR